MRKEEKNQIIEDLVEKLTTSKNFYLADISNLQAAKSSALRRSCFNKNIGLVMVKNTLLKKALERIDGDFTQIYDVLKGSTSIMISESVNDPAKLIKDFRKKEERPILKAAFVQESIYIGDNQLDALISIKSKEEVIADVIALLQSPAKNVISALQSGGQKLSGIVKTLSERAEN
jgi:large subunit ribosomal protein L10